MYSIFNTKSRKPNHLIEGEPPPKKITNEGDGLIKNLSKNQLKTKTTLTEQLLQNKEFVSSEQYSDVTNNIYGAAKLDEFKSYVDAEEEYNKSKSKHLSDRDIKMYREYSTMGEQFWEKYNQINKDVLVQCIRNIESIINKPPEMLPENNDDNLSRHQQEYLKSLKPDSVETKLLKFANRNEQKKDILPGPMDELVNLEKEFTETIEEYSHYDIKKIQKKARSMRNRLKKLDEDIKSTVSSSVKGESSHKKNIKGDSLWDVQEIPENGVTRPTSLKKNTHYTCKPQSFYTIKNGEIIKLNSSINLTPTPLESEKIKFTVDEIKKIPRFANYEVGNVSKVLFLKNLPKHLDETLFREFLKDFPETCYEIKIMKGKMNGQAFIEFENENESASALDILNGVVIKGRPIVAQYGKKNNAGETITLANRGLWH